MLASIQVLLVIVAVTIAIPTLMVFIETVAAVLWRRSPVCEVPVDRPAAGILMPAHNESGVIEHTLAALLPHLGPDDRVLVIADNCTDDTAAIARRFSVTVVERFSAAQRGKGFALAHGMSYWGDSVPEIVVFIDADCRLTPGTLDRIICEAHKHGRPAQATNLLFPPDQPSARDQLSAFAFQFKNLVRPLGLHALGQPCLLSVGVAIPSEILQQNSLGCGNIVEDMQLGLDLAIQGYPPLMVPDSLIFGKLPQSGDAATSQRTRWEHGHIQTLMSQVPRLLNAAISQRRIALLALALEMSVPPLSLLVFVWTAQFTVSLLWLWGTSHVAPFVITVISGTALFFAITLAWIVFGRDVLTGMTLLRIPLYLGWKVPLYLKYLTRRQTAWVRTERDPDATK